MQIATVDANSYRVNNVAVSVLCVPTPKLAPLTRRFNDEGLRARIVHAPEAANDKARVLAEGCHAPRSP